MKASLDQKVSNQFGTIIKKIKVLHFNWEMDNVCYVINNGKEIKIITTDHEKLIEVDSTYLKNKIQEYKSLIHDTQEAIDLIENGNN